MARKRAVAYIDGFNLYHAINDLGEDSDKPLNHLKWLNLWLLTEEFVPTSDFQLLDIFYFTAIPHWNIGKRRRHGQYMRALEAIGVNIVLGSFKQRDRKCPKCGHEWRPHVEKESDVNLAIHLLEGAIRDRYDMGLLITADSDLAPAIKMVRDIRRQKEIRLVTPIGREPSSRLTRASGGRQNCAQMKLIHIERCLFSAKVRNDNGRVMASRPHQYDPLS